MDVFKACFGARDLAADADAVSHRHTSPFHVQPATVSSRNPGSDFSSSPSQQTANVSGKASLPRPSHHGQAWADMRHHSHQGQACATSIGNVLSPARHGTEDVTMTARHTAAPPTQPSPSQAPSFPAAGPKLSPAVYSSSRLMASMTQHSPCVLTALAMDGSKVFQNPMSIRYFGDISKGGWLRQASSPGSAAAAHGQIKQAQAGRPMSLLRSLFSLEGEQQLQEMLALVSRQQPAGGGGGGAQAASWCRVMRVPMDFRPRLPTSSAGHVLCSSPSARSCRAAAEPQSSPPHPCGRSLSCKVNNVDGFRQAQCDAAAAAAASTCAAAQGEQLQAELHEPDKPAAFALGSELVAVPQFYRAPSAKAGVEVMASSSSIMSSSNDVEKAASAVSVAVRNAPARMLSLMTLSMASRSCPTRGADVDDVGAAAAPGHGARAHVNMLGQPGSSDDLALCPHSFALHISEDHRSVSLPAPGTPLGTPALLHKQLGGGMLQLAITSGPCSPSPSRPGSRPLLTPSASLRWPPEVPPAGGSPRRGGQSGKGDAASCAAAAEDTPGPGDNPLWDTAAEEDLQAPLLPSKAAADSEDTDPADDAHAGATAAAPVPKQRLHTAVHLQARLHGMHDAGGERPEGSGAAGQGLTQEGTKGQEREEHPSDFCWHEVFVTSSWDEDGSQTLLIYQTNVTMRTHLETILAELADMQLDTLCQIFPRHVIESMAKRPQGSPRTEDLGHLARSHDDVSILFMDIVGFTSMSKQVAPQLVMTFLNSLFTVFDDLCTAHKVFKVETAGDCYIVSSGLMASDCEGFNQVKQSHDPEDSAMRLLAFAVDMQYAARKVLMPHDGSPVSIRIGIHTGPCVSGIVGNKMPKFCVFGDTMNTASRMESTCIPGRIQISSATYELLMSGGADQEEWEGTGGIAVKGKGVMQTFLWLEPQQGLRSLHLVAPSSGAELCAEAKRSSLLQECKRCSFSSAPSAAALGAELRTRSEARAAASDAPGQQKVFVQRSADPGRFSLDHHCSFSRSDRGPARHGLSVVGQPMSMDAATPRSSARITPAPILRQTSLGLLGFPLQAMGQLMSLMQQSSRLETTAVSSGTGFPADPPDVEHYGRSANANGGIGLTIGAMQPSPYVRILEVFRDCGHVDH